MAPGNWISPIDAAIVISAAIMRRQWRLSTRIGHPELLIAKMQDPQYKTIHMAGFNFYDRLLRNQWPGYKWPIDHHHASLCRQTWHKVNMRTHAKRWLMWRSAIGRMAKAKFIKYMQRQSQVRARYSELDAALEALFS